MKYKDFYTGKLSDEILEHIDENRKLKMDSLIQRLNEKIRRGLKVKRKGR